MPRVTRRGGEFAPLGSVGLRAAGVPAGRAREIEVERAWTKVAGESAARRVRVVSFARGVLVLEASDPAWLSAMGPHVGRLARTLAREHPGLGVRKLRVRLAGEAGGHLLEIPAADGADDAPREPR